MRPVRLVTDDVSNHEDNVLSENKREHGSGAATDDVENGVDLLEEDDGLVAGDGVGHDGNPGVSFFQHRSQHSSAFSMLCSAKLLVNSALASASLYETKSPPHAAQR